MNKVSIIINGIRYDAVECEDPFCGVCELRDICDDGDYYNQRLCQKLNIDSLRVFKKSDKKFEI